MAVTRPQVTGVTIAGDRTAGRAALIGLVSAPLFGFIVVLLTALHYEDLTAMGWHPLRSSTVPWPSSLAIGPYGWL